MTLALLRYRAFRGRILFFAAAALCVPIGARAQEADEASASTELQSGSASTDKPADKGGKDEEKDGTGGNVNPSTGAMTFSGLTWSIGDLPAFDARYERFLMENQSVMKNEAAYYASLNRVAEILIGRPFDSLQQMPTRTRYQQAFEILRSIRSNRDWQQFDGGCSAQIMDQLEAIQTKLRETGDQKGVVAQLESSRRAVENQIRMFRMDPNTQTGSAEKRQAIIQAEQMRLATLEKEKDRLLAEKAKYEAESQPQLAMVKGQFQVYLFTLLTQRRFQHVIVASKLYQSVIADGDLGLSQKNNPIAKESKLDPDMPLTTTVAAQAASEAQEEVRRSVDAYKNLIAADMLDAADRTLHQAFLLGEHMPELRGLPAGKRFQILAVRKTRKKLASAINARDYGQARTELESLVKLAPDFDPNQDRLLIRKATMESDALLLKAKNALFDGDQAAAESAIRQAAKIWPMNPALDDKERFVSAMDDQMRLKRELDELLARDDFRAIAERGEKFGAAVHDDSARQSKLREAMKNLSEIERSLAKYEELSKTGNHQAAWEALDEVAGAYPKDEKLALAYQEATVKASNYIGGVRRAREAEKRGDKVAALCDYLIALADNPTSEKMKASVNQISSVLLKDEIPSLSKSHAGAK